MQTIAGVEVKDNSVTLTQAQYNALKSSPAESCEYTLSKGVTAQVSVNEKQLVFALSSTAGSEGQYVITLNVLTIADIVKVTAVAGVEVKDNSVTLTQAQYNALKLSPAENCDYTLYNGVTEQVTVKDNQLIFALSTTAGTEGNYIVTLNILSIADIITVQTVVGVEVKDNSVTLTQAQYNALKAAPAESCDYTLYNGVTAQVSVNENKLVFDLSSTAGTEGNYIITLNVLTLADIITVQTVAGVEVKDNSVTLTQAQYNALKAAPAESCDYTLYNGVTAQVSVNENQLVFALSTTAGTEGDYIITLNILSVADIITVQTIAGVEVKDNSVTLTQAQYNALKAAPADNCEYTVSKGVTAQITVTETQLVFALSTTAGSEGNYIITLNVLSDLADIQVKTVRSKEVIDGEVALTESEYLAFLNLQNYDEVCQYQAAKGATVAVSFDRQAHTLIFDVLSQDKTNTNKAEVKVNVALPFGTHTLTGGGDKKSANYDYENLAYVFRGSATITDGGANLSGSYAFSAQIYPQSLAQGSEFVLSAVYANNYQIRFALRGVDETHYLIFSDYKDKSNFLNYKEHVSSTLYDNQKGVTLGVIVVDGSMVMTVDGSVVYRRTLEGLSYTEMFVNTYELGVQMKNLQIVSDETQAERMYQETVAGYKDKLSGISIINTSENVNKFVQNDDGSLYVEGKDSDKRVMGALYQNGVPVGGYEYAVSGHLKITDTKTADGKASKVELQIAKDTKYFVKFHLFRYPSNNSFYAYPTVNGKALSQVICEKNTMPKGTEYELDYLFVYSGRDIKVYLKDGSYMPEYKLEYTLDASWGYTMFTIAMRQYCNVTFSNFQTYYGDDFDALVNTLETKTANVEFSAQKDSFVDNGCFVSGNTGTYYKTESAYDKAFVFSSGSAVGGEYWLVSGQMQFGEYQAWTQGELSAYVDERHAVRYVFEYTGSAYQVFHEIKNGNDNWTGYTLIVRPQTKNAATMNFTLVNHAGKTSLLIDGYVYHTVELDFLKNAAATIGGKGGTLILKNVEVNANKQDVEKFVSEMKDYTYVSPYETRINELAKQYKSAEKGGVLLMGSSTMDYWKTWQTDIGGRLGYNVGIGGTIVEDWLYAYDKLVKPFAPSVIVVFLGGNNINDMGHTAEYAASLMANLLNKMHTDFPDAEIHYIYSMPTPNFYKGGKFNTEYGRFIDEMKQLVAQTDWLNGIDTFNSFTENGEVKKDLFRDDGIHLNDEGYKVFSEIVNNAVFNKQSEN